MPPPGQGGESRNPPGWGNGRRPWGWSFARMGFGDGHSEDWRDADAYAPLLPADRSVFAWEWLRRDGRYRAAAARALGNQARHHSAADREAGPGHWGLHAFECPWRPAPAARPVWRADVHPYVLDVRARGGAAPGEGFRLDRLGGHASILRGTGGREHVLVSDGLRTIRLDVMAGSLDGSAAILDVRLRGVEAAERPLLSLRRLLALGRTGAFPEGLYPREARAGRWLLMLRALDALEAGAGQREIAAVLLSPDSLLPRWRSDVPSLRSRAQRLVRGARSMVANYRALLS